jgi:hypothetical protein
MWEKILIRLGAGAAALLALFGLITAAQKGLSIPSWITIERYATGLNFLAVLIFCFFSLTVPKLFFASNYNPKDQELKTLIRVNGLMRQLNTNLLLYAFFLALVYIFYFLSAIKNPDSTSTRSIIDELANLFNFLSSVFIYLSFKVLYDKTLDGNNEPNYYFMDAIVFVTFFLISYILIVHIDWFELADKYIPASVNSQNEKKVLYLDAIKNNYSLIIGILNGLAMGLLFARFISMENSLINIFEKNKKGEPQHFQKILIKNLMIFILPLYAVVQPLFGNFKVEALGPPDIHKNTVFIICLFGKIFFLCVYYYYAHRRWIQIYLFNALNRQGLPESMKTKFEIKETHWEQQS